jgi:hypothetical protein
MAKDEGPVVAVLAVGVAVIRLAAAVIGRPGRAIRTRLAARRALIHGPAP